MAITDAQDLVAAFHRKFDVPQPGAPVAPAMVSQDRHERRMEWISDEIDEGFAAFESSGDDRMVAELADAYVDIIYFALGGLVELGIDGGPLFDEVHRKNMEKIKLPGVAKIAKPESWTPPDIAALVEAQRTKS